jgi:uncharacterized protein
VSLLHALAIFAAGMAAGTINTVVGSGTLITFPVLLAFGYAPVTANVASSVGLAPGSVAGAVGYRRELGGQKGRIRQLSAAAVLGGTIGAVALLVLPASAFEAAVPVFIAIALVLIVAQPWLSKALSARRRKPHEPVGPAAVAGVLLTAVYGGYFGAAQSILMLAVLGIALDDDLQRINALKNFLVALVNVLAAIVFVVAAHVAWGAAALIAGGSVIGGFLGAWQGRRLSPTALRAAIVLVGISALVRLL